MPLANADASLTPAVRIDRCVCCKVRFADALAISRRTGARTLDELQQHLDVGSNCQLCHPYLKRCLTTGQSLFTSIIVNVDEPT